MNLESIKPQNLGSLFMKSGQSDFNLRSPGSYSVRSYLITTVTTLKSNNECRAYLHSLKKIKLSSDNDFKTK